MSSHNTFRVARYVALGAVTALTFSVAAQARDQARDTTTPTGAHQTVISYSDLDLSRDADVRELYARLRRASDEVCGQFRSSPELRTKRLYKSCFDDTLTRAVESVGHAAVTAMLAADGRVRVAGRDTKVHPST